MTENQSQLHLTSVRVRYGETDRMGTFYNAHVLDWFECGRTEALRDLGLVYRELEARGVMLPVVEAHLKLEGRATYDDVLEVRTTVSLSGRARLRFDEQIVHRDSRRKVASGYTLHAVTNPEGRAIRPPGWLLERVPT